MYGVIVSSPLISAVIDSVLEDVEAWQSPVRQSPSIPIVYLDVMHVKIRENRHVKPCGVYVALGTAA